MSTHTYRRTGLRVAIHANTSRDKKLISSCIVSPHFVELLLKLEKDEYDATLWDYLSQTERNFMYLLNQKIFKNRDITFQHLNDCHRLMNRLRILDGSLIAGNILKELLNEFRSLIDELHDGHQISGQMRAVMKKKQIIWND